MLVVVIFVELFTLVQCDERKIFVLEKSFTVLRGLESEMVGNDVKSYITLK
jgi:hypothetical protein